MAAQLSNAEWFASLPGTDQQKASVRNCTHCHTLERVARSRFDTDAMTKVIERMSTYPQLSFPLKIQKLVAARVVQPSQGEAHRRACLEALALC